MTNTDKSFPYHDKEISSFDKLFIFGELLPFGFDLRAIKYEASIPKMPLVLYSFRRGTDRNSWGVWSWELHFRFLKWELMVSQLTKWGIESMKHDAFWKEQGHFHHP